MISILVGHEDSHQQGLLEKLCVSQWMDGRTKSTPIQFDGSCNGQKYYTLAVLILDTWKFRATLRRCYTHFVPVEVQAVHTASTRSVLKQPYLNNIEATENW
jgi:hypothetical protein